MDNLTFYQLALKHKSKINPFGALCQCNWETRTNGRPWESELLKEQIMPLASKREQLAREYIR